MYGSQKNNLESLLNVKATWQCHNNIVFFSKIICFILI